MRFQEKRTHDPVDGDVVVGSCQHRDEHVAEFVIDLERDIAASPRQWHDRPFRFQMPEWPFDQTGDNRAFADICRDRGRETLNEPFEPHDGIAPAMPDPGFIDTMFRHTQRRDPLDEFRIAGNVRHKIECLRS